MAMLDRRRATILGCLLWAALLCACAGNPDPAPTPTAAGTDVAGAQLSATPDPPTSPAATPTTDVAPATVAAFVSVSPCAEQSFANSWEFQADYYREGTIPTTGGQALESRCWSGGFDVLGNGSIAGTGEFVAKLSTACGTSLNGVQVVFATYRMTVRYPIALEGSQSGNAFTIATVKSAETSFTIDELEAVPNLELPFDPEENCREAVERSIAQGSFDAQLAVAVGARHGAAAATTFGPQPYTARVLVTSGSD